VTPQPWARDSPGVFLAGRLIARLFGYLKTLSCLVSGRNNGAGCVSLRCPAQASDSPF
jgi:hypothetical protein